MKPYFNFIDDHQKALETLPSPRTPYPTQLPEGYHGEPKSHRKLSEINRDKWDERENPEFVQTRIGHWKLRKLDRDIEQ